MCLYRTVPEVVLEILHPRKRRKITASKFHTSSSLEEQKHEWFLFFLSCNSDPITHPNSKGSRPSTLNCGTRQASLPRSTQLRKSSREVWSDFIVLSLSMAAASEFRCLSQRTSSGPCRMFLPFMSDNLDFQPT